MRLMLPELPYAYSALEPYISQATLRLHHDKHHREYMEKVNMLAIEAHLTYQPLEAIVLKTAGLHAYQELFINAAQAWNHAFYWRSLSPEGGGEPHGEITQRIEADFGGYQSFAQKFTDATLSQFGNGWTWLVIDGGILKITNTSNADTPIAHGHWPLLAIDVWEHAYYLDYQNNRAEYVAAVIGHLLNWKFANQNLSNQINAVNQNNPSAR